MFGVFLGESWLKCRKEFGHQQSWSLLNIAIVVIIIARVLKSVPQNSAFDEHSLEFGLNC